MKTTRKSLLKRTVALLLTICSLLAVMVPAVSAEETEGTEESALPLEMLTGSVVGVFDFGPMSSGVIGEVNGHDIAFLPHNRILFVYDLDTWEKFDEEYLGFQNAYGAIFDSNGIFWAYGSKTRLYRYDPVTKTGTWTSPMSTDESIHVCDAFEINGKFYMGLYPTAELMEYDPATDTFTNLGKMSTNPDAKRVGAMSHKDGFIYMMVNSNTSGKDPHILVKYDIANKKIAGTLDINETDKEYFADPWNKMTAIVGNTLFITSNNSTKMMAVDLTGNSMRLMDPTEMGLPADSQGIHNGISEVIVEKDADGTVVNEKAYFMLRQKRENVKEPIAYGWSGWSYIYEYNSKTGLATPVETFPHSANSKEDWILDFIHTRRGCLVTVDRPEIEGWTGPSIFTVDKVGKVALYNLASGKVWEDTTLTYGDGSGKTVLTLVPGPEGTNTLYLGCGNSELVSKYDIATGVKTQYPAYSSQVPEICWYEGKCYATGYGHGSLCEAGIDQEVKMLFELNGGSNKPYFHQERLYNMTAGDGKVFTSTAPCKGYLGGYLAWYDIETKTTYVAVEKDKVIYQTDPAGIWYDEKTNAPYVLSDADDVTKEFEGLIANQIPKSIVYQDGYVYGGTGINGGSGATPLEGESAVLFAYDLANRKLVTLDLRTALDGFSDIIDNVRTVAADPDVPGKFWMQVAGTLYSFTYDKTTETFNLKEELSFSKSDYYLYLDVRNGAPMFFLDGYIIADLREEGLTGGGMQAIRMINKENPSENYLLVKTTERGFALCEDNNIYVITQEEQGLARYNTADRIAEIKANKAALDAAEEKINAIGEVTLESEEAIVAARAAYDALPEEVKALVSNLDVLTAAEAKLAELKAAAEKAAADKAAADAVAAKIEDIGEVTLESEEEIKAARAAYDALTDDQKALVDAAKLTAAEEKLAQLKAADKAAADAVTAKIEAIGKVTLKSEADIKAAREAYDALTAEQKALVDETKLTAAETALEALKKPADPDNPKTGDETNLLLPVVLMVVSVMGIAAGVVCTQKFSYKGKHQK